MGKMVNVRLVCDRENHREMLYGSNIEWERKGDVQPVPEAVALKLRAHPDVYELLADDAPKGLHDFSIPLATKMTHTPMSDDGPVGPAVEVEAVTATTVNIETVEFTSAEAKAAIPAAPLDPVVEAEKEAPRAWTESMLHSVKDADVRAEIERRGYDVGKSYTGAKLRERFLAEQSKQD